MKSGKASQQRRQKRAKRRASKRRRPTLQHLQSREMFAVDAFDFSQPDDAVPAEIARPAGGAEIATATFSQSVTLHETASFNDSIATAQDLGTLSARHEREGWVGSGYDSRQGRSVYDPVDFYRFRVAQSGLTTIELRDMRRDVDIFVRDAQGTLLARGFRAGTSNESLTLDLRMGRDYIVEVKPWQASGIHTPYLLSINPQSVEHFGVLNSARTVTSLGTWQSRVRAGDTNSFRFFAGHSGTHSFVLSQLDEDVDLVVTDSSGNELASGRLSDPDAGERVRYSLQRGEEYTVTLSTRDQRGSGYRLHIATPLTNHLGTLLQATSYRGTAHGVFDINHRFQVLQSGEARIQLSGLTRDVDLYIDDSKGNMIARSLSGGTRSESVTVFLEAGRTYYARIHLYGHATALSPYLLQITPAITSSEGLGTIDGFVSRVDQVTSVNRRDHYHFRVARSGWTSIELGALTADVDLELLDAAGNRLEVSDRARTQSESIRFYLRADQTYRLSVFAYHAGSTSLYSLSLNPD